MADKVFQFADHFQGAGAAPTNTLRLPSGEEFRMVDKTSKECYKLWEEGFDLIAFSAAGAKHYFGDAKAAEVVELIETSLTKIDANAFASLKPKTKSVQASLKRIIPTLSR